jgi:hypothetical protein
MRPVAPYSRNIGEAAETAFDRETGKRVEPGLLMTYAEALAQYHLRPEAKIRWLGDARVNGGEDLAAVVGRDAPGSADGDGVEARVKLAPEPAGNPGRLARTWRILTRQCRPEYHEV